MEATGGKEVPIEIPASKYTQIDPMVQSPVSIPAPTTHSPETIPAPTVHSPETIRIRRALSSLFLYKAERDFCEAPSDKSDEITENLAELVEPGVLDMDYDSLMKRSVFASLQALHFSSAAARARRDVELREDSLKAQLSDWKGAHARVVGELDLEVDAHAKDLLVLEKTRAELKIAKGALKSLDEKMLQLSDKVANLEKESKDAAVQYTLMARIAMML